MPKFKEIEGNIHNLEKERFFPGKIYIKRGKILKTKVYLIYINSISKN